MAKNKKLELDTFDFDGELDLPDFDFGDGPKIQDDRKPATKLLFSAGQGYAESLASGENIRSFVKKSLPRGYGEALDVTDQTLGTLRNHINTTAKEIRPVINDIKKTSQRLIPAAEKILPRKMAAHFKNWTQSVTSSNQAQLDREQMKEASIQAELGNIFQEQAQEQQKNRAENNARERLRDGMNFARHKDTMSMLAPMVRGIQELSQYQRKIGVNYQRKMLELSLRSYYVHAESLEESKRQNQVTTTHLEAIMKNTALPEFVKLKNSERLKEVIRNRFINGVGDTLMDKRRNFIKNLIDRIGKQVNDKVRGGADQIRAGLGAYDSLAELREMQAQFGQQQTGGQQAAELGGGMLAQHHTGKLARWLNKRLEKNDRLSRGGNNLLYYLQNAPQLAYQWAKGTGGIGKNNFGADSEWLWSLKDSIRSVLSPESTNVEIDKLEDVRNVDTFNRRTNRSITDIIPGYLARIYRELKILRTGDENQQLVEFDYTSNKFQESSDVTKNILKRLAGKSDKDALKYELDSFVKEIDKGGKLSDTQKRALGRLMLEHNLKNGVGDPALYSDSSSEVYQGMNRQDAQEMADVFKNFFADDNRNQKRHVFARQFQNLGLRLADKRATIQDFVNVNQRHHLESLGLLTEGGDQIDMERLRQYLLEDDDAPAPGGAGGNPRRASRRRGEPAGGGNRGGLGRPIPRLTNLQQPGVPPQAQGEPPPVGPGGNMSQESVSEIVRAIEAANPTSAVNDSNRLLATIVEMLERGILTQGGGPGGGGGGSGGRWWNRSLGSLGAGAWDSGIKGLKWLNNKRKSHIQVAKNWMTSGWSGAKNAGNWLSNKWKDFNDIYIEGEAKPRLLSWRLKAGEYYDQASGQVIKSLRDIRGAVVDANGNIIMSREEAMKAFERSRVGKRALAAFGFLKKQGQKSWELTKRLVPGIYGTALGLAEKGYKKLGELLDQPQDVYVAGKTDPVLLAVTMRAGGYRSRVTGDPVTRPSQIDGPVLNSVGDVVLTEEQLASGLLNKHGQPLKTGYRGLFQRGKNLVMGTLKRIQNAGNRMKDWMLGKVKGLAGGFEFNLGMSLTRQTRSQSMLLLQIRDMLNDRLPGERTTFAETVDVASGEGGKKVVEGVKNRFRKLKSKIEELDFKDKVANFKERLRDSKNRGKDKLSILFEKYFGKKRVLGDRDGDGIREGSYQDLMARQKEKLKAAKEKLAEKLAAARDKASGLGGAGMMKKLLDLFKKKDEDDDDDDGLNIDIDAANDTPEKRKKRREREARRRRRQRQVRNGRAGQAGRGIWGKTKNLLGRAGGGLLRGGGMLARGALGLGGLALGGLGSGLLSGAGAAVSGLGSLALSGLGALGSGLVALVSAPVVLTGLAVAAVGAAGYYGYKYFTRAQLDTYSTVRYAQYGFLASDETHLQAVFSVEKMLEPAVVFSAGKALLDEKKINIRDLVNAFGIDVKNPQQLENFIQWFDNRFKPVFLNNMAALRAVDAKKSLQDVKDLTPAQKRQYFNVAKFAGGPYDVVTSPFPDQGQLAVGSREVAAAIEVAEAALKKEEASAPAKPAAGTAGAAAALAATSTGGQAAALKAALDRKASHSGVRMDANGNLYQSADKAKINQLTQQAKVGAAAVATGAGVTSMSGPSVMADIFNTGRLDAMTALRYRTYGLRDLEADKVRTLFLMDAEVAKGLTIRDGVATWTGSVENMIATMGSAFGVQGLSNDDAYSWINWFNSRYLPTYLAYVTAMASATKKNRLDQAKLALMPTQAVDVATMVYTAKGSENGSPVSVWQVATTPWPGYQLNNDAKTIEGNFQSIKDAAKQSKVIEESTNVQVGITNNSTGSQVKNQQQQGFFSRLFGQRQDSQGKPVSGNIFSRVFNNAKDMVSEAFSGGREINHPGNGTGGDINAIPLPKGSGSWEALRGTISAAAQMTGVDEKLMATMAAIESGFNPTVKASTSSATGLYQFTRDTWSDMMRKFGAKYGIAPGTPPTDARANALLGGEFLKMNAKMLSGLGRKITDTDLYLAHFLGAGGAKKFLSADPNAIAANVMPAEAAANASIFYSNGSPLTIGQVYSKLNGLVRAKGQRFGLNDGSEKLLAGGATPVPAGQPTTATGKQAAALTAALSKKASDHGVSLDANGNLQQKPKAVSIPVSDQSPMPFTGPAAAPSVAKPVVAAAVAVGGSEVPPEATGPYMSQRSLNVNAQQQQQRDMAAERLTTTNQILEASHKVHQKSLEVMIEVRDALKGWTNQAPKSQVLDKPAEVARPAKVQASRPMTSAPVSMAVNR